MLPLPWRPLNKCVAGQGPAERRMWTLPSSCAYIIPIIISPGNLFGHLSIDIWEELVRLKPEWPQSPHRCPFHEEESARPRRCAYAQSAPSLPDHAPGALEYPSRAVWVSSPGLSSKSWLCYQGTHPTAPERPKGWDRAWTHWLARANTCAQSPSW